MFLVVFQIIISSLGTNPEDTFIHLNSAGKIHFHPLPLKIHLQLLKSKILLLRTPITTLLLLHHQQLNIVL